MYKTEDFGKQWDNFQQLPIVKALHQLPPFVSIQQDLNGLKTLIEQCHKPYKVPLSISVHRIDEEQLGYLFYFDTNHAVSKELWHQINNQLNKPPTYYSTTRKYAGQKITTFHQSGNHRSLSYIQDQQYIIASYAPLLIEDIARLLADKQKKRWDAPNNEPYTQGNLYVNFAQLSQLLHIFINQAQIPACSAALTNFSPVNNFSLRLSPHHALLNGFVHQQATATPYFTNTLTNQTANDMRVAPYIPQRTSMLQHITFNDAAQFYISLQQYRSTTPHKEKNYDLLNDTLHPLFSGEIGHCTLATKHQKFSEQLVFIRVNYAPTWITSLISINAVKKLPENTRRPLLSIYQLTNNYFQYSLIGLLFPTFEAKYITYIDDYVVLSNSHTGLQTWHTQYQQRATWENDPQQNAWLANTLDQAQWNLWIDVQKVWPPFVTLLKPKWQQVYQQHANTLKRFRINLQMVRNQNMDSYMSVLFNYHAPQTHAKEGINTKMHQQSATMPIRITNTPILRTDAPIISPPWLVKSHRKKGHHILLQDALHQLYLLDPTGVLLWKTSLEGPIKTEIFEVDYYKNHKIQYVFGTDRRFHLIDYHGHKIAKYPHPLPVPMHTGQLRVIDYELTKNYRFLLANAQGKIYLKNKLFQSLSDWSPKSCGHSFADTPQHINVQGKDYFLLLQTNGTIQALNRRGKNYPGFPINLKTAVHNPLLIRTGKNEEDTHLIVLTDRGQRVQLNLRGTLKEQVQLKTLTKTKRFVVCPNRAAGHSYVIVRQDSDKASVLNESGDEVFALPSPTSRGLLQYYDFGHKHRFYVWTNMEQQLTYLYDRTGTLLCDNPWHNAHAVSLLFFEKEQQLKLYTNCDQLCSVYTLTY